MISLARLCRRHATAAAYTNSRPSGGNINGQQSTISRFISPFHTTTSNSTIQYFSKGTSGMLSHSKHIEMMFLGTGAMLPTAKRGTSSLLLRMSDEVWMFDCGESTQLKLQQITVQVPRLSKIFITHLHGDHIFGLPGLLCFMNAAKARCIEQNKSSLRYPVVEIYGPVGLRQYIRTAAQFSHSRFADYVVHEIQDIPRYSKMKDEEFTSKIQLSSCDPSEPLKGGGELKGGEQIQREKNGYWTLCGNRKDGVVVRAAPISHTVPTLGFTVQEPAKLGKLNMEMMRPIIDRNVELMRANPERFYDPSHPKADIRPHTLLQQIKRASFEEPDKTFTMPDGTVVVAKDCVGKAQPGKLEEGGGGANSLLSQIAIQNCYPYGLSFLIIFYCF
jgi:ribonuclease Z